eukprot:TRINITY_DN1410_c0_g1_i3.p1 TRINITY_DN1410_c0_g1~~TRINITY_DN1410_c0_g1_i3.p1  ORF type:complete len:268 (-),score=11.90 TRINITY_DN1410_c0_g1_i3:84-887(-)
MRRRGGNFERIQKGRFCNRWTKIELIIIVTFYYKLIKQQSQLIGVNNLQMPPQKNSVSTRSMKILMLITRLMMIATCILSFIVVTPFDSLWVLLLGIQIIYSNVSFQVSIVTEKNDTPYNEKNYQFNYILNRVFVAVLNGAGFTDVISDIVWGIEIIRKFNQFFIIFGVIILVLCFVDLLCLVHRVYHPGKIPLKFHILTITVEVIILLISVATIMVQFLTGLNLDGDFLGLSILSIFSTVVNLSHHVAIMMDFLVQQKQSQVTTFS